MRLPKRNGRKLANVQDERRVILDNGAPPPDAAPSDEQVEVRLAVCPDCGHELEESQGRVIEQTILELPVVVPRVIRLKTYRYECPGCEHTVSSHHPLQVSTATGAAGTQLGPRALAIATALNKDFKLPLRKSCQVLERCFGLPLSPGGLSQAMERVAKRLEGQYAQSLVELRQSEVVYSDETGWYTLWVFTNQETTYYRIVNQRTRETARSIIGENFAGVLVSDCLSIYDDLNPIQQKCYAHHLKALSVALKTLEGKGSAYLLELRALLHSAQLLKPMGQDLAPQQVEQWRQFLEKRVDELLAQPRGQPDNLQRQQEEKIRQRLAKQRDHLFTFLDYEVVEATNNRAERQLRPAVISRKISCGNKTEQGANTWAILASLAATAAQKGDSFIDQVAQAMVLKPDPVSTR
ncbi:MAG: IS66 family transposase [Leptolyngbyaceae cyanobacterium SL_5_9]|nr:IS66 family transposase [Leptolyngbyaceae cyanobacterium SL_5_9]NJO75317.1 IS66 family transposase [Leptolyngbyaceae cyanobacterium RM1_406_9]